MAMKRMFCSRVPSCNYVFTNGRIGHFVAGRYYTDVRLEIEELEKEVNEGNPTIYIDVKQKEVDMDTLDPLEYIKKKAVEEYIAAQAAANNPKQDRGTSGVKVNLNVQTTDKLIAAADSNQK